MRRVGALLLAAFGLAAAIQAINYVKQDGTLFPDFFGLWSWGKFAVDRQRRRHL